LLIDAQGENMPTMTVRGIDEKLAQALKNKAHQEGVSVNAMTLRLIRESLGLDKAGRVAGYDDLDHLAGTWTQDDAEEFKQATAVFEQIDRDMWR